MEKTVKLWQVILATIGLLITIGSYIMTLATTVKSLELQNMYQESILRDHGIQFKDINTQFKEINGQFVGVNSKLTDILVNLQNKEDRTKK